jgi:triacylglycerol esterase/lipase EstA (alpha/beta hydrolase family)
MLRFVPGIVAAFVALVGAVTLFASADAQSAPSGPALETPEATLAAALHCPDSLANLARNPVLLVPGTGLNGGENWDWSYGPALKAAGFTTCTVDLPGAGMGDIQVASEYVVFAIKKMAKDSGDKVAVVGYSQGGLEPRWALKYWPELRQLVSDYVGIAPASHGADTAAQLCGLPAGCGPSILQMSPGSKLLKALDTGPQAFGPVDYTVIYSTTDGTVIPPAAMSPITASPGVNVSNISVQSLCPASTLVHISVPADGTVYAIVLDALLRPGAADASRIGKEVCGSYVPGVTADIAAAKAIELNGIAFGRVLGYPAAKAEPALKAYAAAPAAPNTGNTVGGQAGRAEQAWLELGAIVALTAVLAVFGTRRAVLRRR